MILTLRTDTPVAELGLFKPDGTQVSYSSWQADRRLAKELLGVIKQQLDKNNVEFTALTGIVVFTGPGSFTGLRIGITVVNALAYSLNIAIIGVRGDKWISEGITKLARGENNRIVLPHYGAEARITQPKK